jgi:ABC-2 type transport system permease protein
MTTPTTPAQPVHEESLHSVLSARTRPSRPSALSASLTFGWRALLKIKHVPEQLFDVTIFPVMLTLLFTYLFGGALAGSTEDYLQFLLPGILVQTVIFTTVYTGVTLNTDIERGVFDRFRSLPIWRPSPLVGAQLGDMVRYTLGSIVVVVLGLVLGYRPDGGLPGVVAAIALLLVFAFGIGWIFTLLGLVMRTPNAVMSVGMMVLFPLTFASNIFVSPDTMPGWLQTFVDHNPITRMVTATRGLMNGDPVAGEIGWVLVAALAFTVVFAPIVMRRYQRIN